MAFEQTVSHLGTDGLELLQQGDLGLDLLLLLLGLLEHLAVVQQYADLAGERHHPLLLIGGIDGLGVHRTKHTHAMPSRNNWLQHEHRRRSSVVIVTATTTELAHEELSLELGTARMVPASIPYGFPVCECLLSLCLSRACLGKTVSLVYKVVKSAGFFLPDVLYPARHLRAKHGPCGAATSQLLTPAVAKRHL
jgi:hypothetical protein